MNDVSLLLEDPGFLVCAIAAQHSAPTPIHPISQHTLAPHAYSSAYPAPIPLLTHKEPPTQRDSLTHTLSLSNTHTISLSLSITYTCVENSVKQGKMQRSERGASLTTLCRFEQSLRSAAAGPVGGRGRRGVLSIDTLLGAGQVFHRRR